MLSYKKASLGRYCVMCTPDAETHSKNEGMKYIPTQYDRHTFSFLTIGMKEAFILL